MKKMLEEQKKEKVHSDAGIKRCDCPLYEFSINIIVYFKNFLNLEKLRKLLLHYQYQHE